VNRAVARGTGEAGAENVEEVRYEGYGPGGVAVLVDCMTDNRNRTVGEVRHAFSKCGGNLGTDGSVAYLFTKCGVIAFAAGTSEDAVMETALDAGAEDVQVQEDGSLEVLTTQEAYAGVVDALGKGMHKHTVLLRLETPAPGTAYVGAFSCGGMIMVCLSVYLYGEKSKAAVERDESAWQAWMDGRACQWSGVEISTASTRLSSSILR